MSNETLLTAFRDFLRLEPKAVLFAGAGVSARAGLPTWRGYLEQLAELARGHDQMTRHHMMERLHEEDYLGAAELYFLSRKIRQADKFQYLTRPLKVFDASLLEALVSLPFSAIVTTNYDRALLAANASANHEAAEEVNLHDTTLAAAPFNVGFYIARIHGRVESPESMQLSGRHYEALAQSTQYQDFLAHIFTRTRLLFVGFSFLDPAIQQVLTLVERKVGKYHAGRHLALLPKAAPTDFIKRLEMFSISPIFYEAADHHNALWESIEQLNDEKEKVATTKRSAEVQDPFDLTRKYLASCFARSALGARALPLRQAVVEGIVSKLISMSGTNGTSESDLRDVIAAELTLTTADAEPLVEAAIQSLSKEELVTLDRIGDALVLRTTEKYEDGSYGKGLIALVDGAMNRFVVRSGGSDQAAIRKCLHSLFEYLVLRRGWDLGAAFASGEIPVQLEMPKVLQSVGDCANRLSPADIVGLSRAVEDLIRNPNKTESRVLVDAGRASFALELVSRTARDTLFHRLTLPERVYLDANVLMPAFAPGHPYYGIYQTTISKLIEAATSALSSVEIVAYRGFLNEIVSHRRLAIAAIEEMRGDFAELRKETIMFGALRLNVYVAGFANKLAEEQDLTFREYLIRYAPYSTEAELARWFEEKGLVVKGDAELKSGADELPNILHMLEVANADGGWNRKEGMLILHDAVQVAALARDMRLGRRAVFVSADRRLRENLTHYGLETVTTAIMSHVGLAQLVDLLVGGPTKERGLARMLWGARTSGSTEQVRNYFVDIALDHYHEGFAMEMGKLVDDVVQDTLSELERQGLGTDVNDERNRREVMRVVEGFEDGYFRKMREVIDQTRKDSSKD